MKWKIGLFALALPIFGVAGAGEADACAAVVGHIKIALRLEENGIGRALISEYDCAMMPPFISKMEHQSRDLSRRRIRGRLRRGAGSWMAPGMDSRPYSEQ